MPDAAACSSTTAEDTAAADASATESSSFEPEDPEEVPGGKSVEAPTNGAPRGGPEKSSLKRLINGIEISFLEAWRFDVFKAIPIGMVLLFIPFINVADMCAQCVLKALGKTDFEDRHTRRGRKAIDWLCALNLAGIFSWICVWGDIWFTLNVLFAKLTYIFLSWLNGLLRLLGFTPVCFLVIVVGFIMFMLPPVPGIPVYVFTGIVITMQAKDVQSLGLASSIVLATFMSVCTKLVACVGQYFIGVWMGQSVKIQQLIGVDKVPTRAIEKILDLRGLAFSKVCILIGGPDWPVSVTCGILRVSIPQMLIGTLPVAFIAAPCVVAGAFLTQMKGGKDDPWVARSALAVLASTIGQGGALALAVVFTGRVIATRSEELAAPRAEHREVEELRLKERAYNLTYLRITAWGNMSICRKAVITSAAVFTIISNCVLTFLGSICFRSFYLSSEIGDDYEDYPPGLRGNALNIVKLPGGALMLGLFALSVLLHICHVRSSARMVAAAMTDEPAEPEPAPAGPTAEPEPPPAEPTDPARGDAGEPSECV